MVVKQILPAFDSNTLGSTSSVKVDIFSRFLQNVDIQVVGTRSASAGTNYTGVTAAALKAVLPSAGGAATGTLTLNGSGVPVSIAIVAGGAGWVVGDKFTVFDPTGRDLVCTVATVTGGAIATATLGGGPMFAEDVIEYVEIIQDSEVKSRIVPARQRKLDALLNVSDDPMDKTYLRIPFAQTWHPWSQWGSKDIGQLQIQVKLMNTVAGTFSKIQGNLRFVPVAVALVRGDVLVQADIPVTNVVGGTNIINDLPWQRVVAVTKLILDSPAITLVKVKVGDTLIYSQSKSDVVADVQQSPQYKVPATIPFDFFPVILDDRADPADFVYIVASENGTPARRPVQIEYFWDSTIAAPASFNILAQGLERGAKQSVSVAKA